MRLPYIHPHSPLIDTIHWQHHGRIRTTTGTPTQTRLDLRTHVDTRREHLQTQRYGGQYYPNAEIVGFPLFYRLKARLTDCL